MFVHFFSDQLFCQSFLSKLKGTVYKTCFMYLILFKYQRNFCKNKIQFLNFGNLWTLIQVTIRRAHVHILFVMFFNTLKLLNFRNE